MKMVNCCLVIGLISLLCQGCASPPVSESKWQGRAKLMDLGNGTCQHKNGLIWQVERSDIFNSGQQAANYVKDLQLAGHSDWRLPSTDELYELCNLYDMQLAGDCPIKLKGSYWSRNGDIHAGEWHAYPLCGGSDFQYIKSKSGRVLAVRP